MGLGFPDSGKPLAVLSPIVWQLLCTYDTQDLMHCAKHVNILNVAQRNEWKELRTDGV